MAECRNPECRDGYQPGIVTAGKGTANAPILGATMRWGWVKCRACNASQSDKEAGVTYQKVNRAPGEIQERARLADQKAVYTPQPQAARAPRTLASIAASTPAPASNGSSPQIDKLLDQVSKLADQVSDLLEENRQLRKQLSAASPVVVGARKKAVKKGGSSVSASTKASRTLS